MKSPIRKWMLAAVVVLLLGILAYRSRGFIGLQGFSWHRLVLSVRQAQPAWVLLALAAMFVAYALRALRWARFSRPLGPAPFLPVYSGTLMGFTALLLLGRVGEPVRPILLARKLRLPISSMFGIYVLERIFDGLSTAVIAGFSLLLVERLALRGGAGEILVAGARTTGLLIVGFLIAAISFLVYFRLHGGQVLEQRLAAWRARSGWRQKVSGILVGFSEGLQAVRTWADLLVAVGYSAAHWGLVALAYVWVARSFGGKLAEIGFAGAMLVLAFTMLGSTLQLPGVGVGSQVASFLAFTAVFGVEKEPAAAASIVLWLVTFGAVSLVGIPLLIREGWSMGELKRMARVESEASGSRAIPEASEVAPGWPSKPGDPPR